jgi:hypothetical protein
MLCATWGFVSIATASSPTSRLLRLMSHFASDLEIRNMKLRGTYASVSEKIPYLQDLVKCVSSPGAKFSFESEASGTASAKDFGLADREEHES